MAERIPLIYNPNEETTIIDDKYELESDIIHTFHNLKLIKGGLLTVIEFNSKTNNTTAFVELLSQLILCLHHVVRCRAHQLLSESEIEIDDIYIEWSFLQSI